MWASQFWGIEFGLGGSSIFSSLTTKVTKGHKGCLEKAAGFGGLFVWAGELGLTNLLVQNKVWLQFIPPAASL
jgi:hypothetical protein